MTRGEVHEVDEDLPISENSPTYSANLASDRRSSTAPTSIGLRERWRSVPTGWRSVIIVVLAVVLVGALIRLTSAVTEGNVPQGPQSSSFSPSPEGLEAYSQLLSASGVRVQQLTAPLQSRGVSKWSDGRCGGTDELAAFLLDGPRQVPRRRRQGSCGR